MVASVKFLLAVVIFIFSWVNFSYAIKCRSFTESALESEAFRLATRHLRESLSSPLFFTKLVQGVPARKLGYFDHQDLTRLGFGIDSRGNISYVPTARELQEAFSQSVENARLNWNSKHPDDQIQSSDLITRVGFDYIAKIPGSENVRFLLGIDSPPSRDIDLPSKEFMATRLYSTISSGVFSVHLGDIAMHDIFGHLRIFSKHVDFNRTYKTLSRKIVARGVMDYLKGMGSPEMSRVYNFNERFMNLDRDLFVDLTSGVLPASFVNGLINVPLLINGRSFSIRRSIANVLKRNPRELNHKLFLTLINNMPRMLQIMGGGAGDGHRTVSEQFNFMFFLNTFLTKRWNKPDVERNYDSFLTELTLYFELSVILARVTPEQWATEILSEHSNDSFLSSRFFQTLLLLTTKLEREGALEFLREPIVPFYESLSINHNW